MTTDDAKFILSALHAGEKPGDEEGVVEALKMAETDPDLKAWLDEMQKFDAAVSAKLAAIQPPSDLHSTILAGLHVSMPRPWWKKPVILTAAAAVLFFATFLFTVFEKEPGSQPLVADASAFSRNVVEQIQSRDHLAFMSNEPEQVHSWLQNKAKITKIPVPGKVDEMPTHGCCFLRWDGELLSLICFRESETAAAPTVHLVVGETTLFPEMDQKKPRFEKLDDWTTAIWREGERTFLLAVKGGDVEKIQRLMSSSGRLE